LRKINNNSKNKSRRRKNRKFMKASPKLLRSSRIRKKGLEKDLSKRRKKRNGTRY
jgi:hypothetical protein